jgi:hypothetical protein
MAKACSPYAPPKFIERSEAADRGEYLGAALRNAEASGMYTKVREGFDEAWKQEQIAHLQQMLPMDFKDLNNYFLKSGWISLDKKATKAAVDQGFADPVYKASRDIDKIGTAAAVTKTYLESVSGGVLQLADNFLRKVNAGEAATVEGMAFAQQMQQLSRFGGYVLGWDQAYGRAVRMQGLRNKSATRDLDKYIDDVTDQLGNMGQYQNKFQEIAAKLQDPMQKADGVNELINLAKRVQFLGDPAKIARTSMAMEIAGNAWSEVFINGLLSAPATFAANASGLVWTVARPMLQLGAAKMFSVATGSKMAEQAAAEAAASLSAIYSAFGDAAQLGWHAAKTETTIYQAGASQELKDRVGIHGEVMAEVFQRRGWDRPDDGLLDTITKIGQITRLPSRALLGTDEMAKHLVVRGEVAARAVQNAAKQGVDFTDKAALQTFIDSEMNAAFSLKGPEVWDKYKVNSVYNLQTGIMAEADAATFQEVNGFAQQVQKVLSNFPILRPFIPFVRTPLNILKQGFVESTGLGAIMNAGKALADSGFNPTVAKIKITQQLMEDPGETFRITGQIALTTSLAATFYGMAMSGSLIGGGPGRWASGGRNSDAQKAWEQSMREQGKSPYSIIVGNMAIPFDRFGEPVSIVLRLAADMGMYSSYVSQGAQEEWMAGLASIMVSGLYQASFLKGINDVVDIVSDPSATFGKKGGRTIQNWMATQTPFGGLLNYVDKVVDPYKHAYEGATFTEVMRVHEDTFGTGIFGKIADRIPGFNGTPAMVDQIAGALVPALPGAGPSGLNPLQMAVPFMPRGIKGADDVWTAIYSIKGSYQEKRPTDMRLTNAEQQDLNARMSRMVLNGKTVREAILEYYNSTAVQKYVGNRGAAFSDVRTKVEAGFDQIVNDYYQAALTGLMTDNRQVRERALLREGMKQAAEQGNFDEARSIDGRIDELFKESRLRGVF